MHEHGTYHLLMTPRSEGHGNQICNSMRIENLTFNLKQLFARLEAVKMFCSASSVSRNAATTPRHSTP